MWFIKGCGLIKRGICIRTAFGHSPLLVLSTGVSTDHCCSVVVRRSFGKVRKLTVTFCKLIRVTLVGSF